MALESFKQALQALASNYGLDITQKARGLSTQLNKAQSYKKDKAPI